MRGVAIITDGTLCSKDFLKEFILELNQFENITKINFNLQSFNMDTNYANQKVLSEFLYYLKTSLIPVIILLLPQEYLASVFKVSEFYGLTGKTQTWIIPNYHHGVATLSVPERILTFKHLDIVSGAYSNLQKVIPKLLITIEKSNKNM